MRISSLAAIAAVTLGFTLAGSALATAQSEDSSTPHKKVFGYQDAQTGEFRPFSQVDPELANTTAPSTGTFQLTITIKIASSFPTGTVRTIGCGANVTESSMSLTTAATAAFYEETAASYATVSGTTATCTVNIPYSWVVPAASATTLTSVTGSYTVQVSNSAVAAGPPLLRLSGGDFLSLKAVPATGAVTKTAISVTI
jgi:hypothetical protein